MATRTKGPHRPPAEWGREPLSNAGQNPASERLWFMSPRELPGAAPRNPVGGLSRSGLNPAGYGIGTVPREPRPNEAEYGCPRVSRDGFGLKAAMSRAGVIREQPPLIANHVGMFVYKNFYGAFAARPASQIAIIRRQFYSGELPMDQQPILNKPLPWSDPTRGLP